MLQQALCYAKPSLAELCGKKSTEGKANWLCFAPSIEIGKDTVMLIVYLQPISQEKQSLAAHDLLAKAWKDCFLSPMPAIARSALGKPYFAGNPVYFSLSHTAGAVLCVLCSQPIGADIERLRPYSDRLVHRVLSPEEHRFWQASANKELTFFCLWTRKEAYLKWTGEGLYGLPACPSVHENDLPGGLQISTFWDKHYALSLCCAKEEGAPEIHADGFSMENARF